MNWKQWLKNDRFLEYLVVAVILGIGLAVRIIQYPKIPPGFNQDEAGSAYEAYALALTGKDKWGNAWPAYFPAWGSGQNVLLAYLSIPVVKLLGLSIFSARLIPLSLGILTLPLLYATLRSLPRYGALLSVFVVAVVPWHFMLSRWALESNLVPFCMLAGCALVAKALLTARRRWILPALLPFAAALYAYGTTVLVLPVLLGLLGLLFARQIRQRWGAWLLALGLFLVAVFPFLLFFGENYLLKRNVPWTDHLFFATPLLPADRLSQVTSASWLDTLHRNVSFAFSGFNDGTAYNLLPGFNLLFVLIGPAVAIGFLAVGYRLIRFRRNGGYSASDTVLGIFWAWLLASTGLAFAFDLNVNRFNHFFLPCIVLAGWALGEIISSLRAPVSRQAIRGVLAGWFVLESFFGIQYYFSTYASGDIRSQFNAGLKDAFAAAATLPVQQVRITDRMPLAYVYALFFLQYPPADFQHTARMEVTGGTYKVYSFGKYLFYDDGLNHNQAFGYLSRKNEYQPGPKGRKEVLYSDEFWEVGIIE
ncbi:hypothetical protein LRS06_18595 [Hymenobacter sp. J193]|uniref:ArnT family glycosyltransferase n=1 Tax=Hymenobacter sp. J193 TaxID=2898429 RepID=UPI0021519ACE|nr:hypothetical protein [Hymenobacter sp. J193]MCR5889742.1 hypothetical protein [Hymenobacter sp. J193]